MDDELPTITCPVDVTASTSDDGTGSCTTTVNLGIPARNDNCSVASVIAQVSGVTIDTATYQFAIGNTEVNWIITDGSGNIDSCQQQVTVLDDELPTITCPVDVTASTSDDGTGSCTTTVNLGIPARNDNCSVASVIAQVSGVTIDTATYQFGIGNTEVNWIITDGSGNIDSCQQQVTVLDDELPDFTVPAVDTICRNFDCTYDISPANTGNVSDETDNCSTGLDATFSNDFSNLHNCDTAGYIIRTWSLTDDNGNTALKTQIIWVEPTSKAVATPQQDTICNATAVSIRLTSPTAPIRPVRFRYFTEAGAGVAVIPANGTALSGGTTLTNTITNSTDTAMLVKFIITPYTRQAGTELEKCTGINDTAYIWVEPIAKVTATPQQDTICNAASVSIRLTSPAGPTRPVRFRYVTEANAGVTALPINGTSLPENTLLTNTITNTTDTAQLVKFIITPYTRQAGSELEKCTGINDTAYIWVEPTAKVAATPQQDTICNATAVSIRLTSSTGPTRPVRFRYLTEANAGVTILPASGTALPENTLLTNTITNTTSVAQLVRFIITPYTRNATGEAEKCTGINDTAYIWVSPTLRVVIDTVSTYIGGNNIRCFGENNGFIKLNPEGGITAFAGYDDSDLTYSWNSGWRTTKDIYTLIYGNYHVDIVDKLGCSDDTTIILTQPVELQVQVEVIDALSCYGNDGRIAPLTNGGTTTYSYRWTPPLDYFLDDPIYQDTLYNVIDGYYKLRATDINGCKDSVNFDLSQPGAVPLAAQPSKIYGEYLIKCFGENSGEIATYNKYQYDIIYHWEGPNGFDSTFQNTNKYNYVSDLYAGRYTLTYTDVGTGCSGIYIQDMNEPLPLQINQTTISEYTAGYNVTCFGSADGNIYLNTLSGGHEDPYTFDWEVLSGVGTVDTAARNQVNIAAGIYTVTVSDTFNCAVTDTFELVQPDEIMIIADVSSSIAGGYNLNCYGESTGYIKLQASGGSGATYQYQWVSPPGNSNELTNLPAGDYMVTVTDGMGCPKKDTIHLTQPQLLQVDSADISDYNGYAIACLGLDNGSITVWPSGGTPNYTFNWLVNGFPLPIDTAYADNLVAGAYLLEITDANNCQINWAATLEEPARLTMNIEVANINCTGTRLGSAEAQVNGGIEPYTYQWDHGETTATITNLSLGNYPLTVKDDNQCVVEDTAVIDQNTEVQIDIQIINPISCYGSSDGVIQAQANDGVAPYNFIWQGGPSSPIYSDLDEDTYSVTVTDNEGCVGNQSLVLSDPEPLKADFTVTDVSCFRLNDGSVYLNAQGGTAAYHYYWNNNLISGSEVVDVAAGTYGLKVVDAENCEADTSVTMQEPEELLISMDERYTVYPFCPDWQNGALAVQVSGGTPEYIYSWTDYAGESDSVLNDIKEGSYKIRITDAHDCIAESVFRLKALNTTCLGIPSGFTPNTDPDGENDLWDISYINEDGGEASFHEVYPQGVIQVYDRLGNLVYRCTGGCSEAWNGEDLKGRPLPVDSYYYIIELNTGDGEAPLKGVITIIR